MGEEAYDSKWEGWWGSQDGVATGQLWDAGKPSPALTKLLQGRTVVDARGKACLVPGCGRGYDVVEFLRQGAARAVGVDLSPSAVKVASEYVRSQAGALGLEPDKAAVVVGNWLDEQTDGEQFDVGYDFTFFCALHPSMRSSWASGWHRRLKAGGRLITLMFPLNGDPAREGPPWPVTEQMYEEVLTPLGFKCVYQEKVPDEDVSKADRIDKESMAVWEKVAASAL